MILSNNAILCKRTQAALAFKEGGGWCLCVDRDSCLLKGDSLKESLITPTKLEVAISQRNGWARMAIQHCQNEEYYRDIIIRIGKLLGPEAYTCDDGTVQEDVLCAKVVEVLQQKLGK